MSDQDTQQEPSMEEILASIKRIISENENEEIAAVSQSGARAASDAIDEPKVVLKPEPEVVATIDENVLELTDEVQDDGTVVNINTGERVEGEESSVVADPLLKPELATEPVDHLAAEALERLVSENAAMESVLSLSAFAAAVDKDLRTTPPHAGPRTIEDLVKDVMRPIIREWLDQNLPLLVEGMVGREIERLGREAEDVSQH
mgnify:CR=1 FL=1